MDEVIEQLKKDTSVTRTNLEQAIALLQRFLSFSNYENLEILIRQERPLVPVYEEGNTESVGLLQKGPQLLVIEVADFEKAGEIIPTKR